MSVDRFLLAQAPQLSNIEAELQHGQKVTHWIWYVFPQIAGLGASATSKHYAIASLSEAREYLAHPILGARLRHHAQLVTACPRPIESVLGYPDHLKFHSSMTLFDHVSPGEVFDAALRKHFGGQRDANTLRILVREEV
jgi:uncharacterized protein (DUF1810 family)